jgi:hypothetical protein
MPETRRLRRRVLAALEARVSPERTRRPTWLERIASVIVGFDWKGTVQSALNSGKPIEGAFALAVVLPTVIFLLARSSIGFARWRLQRELWRRDVERLSAAGGSSSSAGS